MINERILEMLKYDFLKVLELKREKVHKLFRNLSKALSSTRIKDEDIQCRLPEGETVAGMTVSYVFDNDQVFNMLEGLVMRKRRRR